jgi:predicted Zn-dependent protease
MGEYDKALADYEAVVRSNPRFTDARYAIATVHWKRQEFREAGEVCRMLVETDPDDPRGYDCRGAALMKQKRLLEALNLYQKAVARLPKNGALWYSLALAYKAVGMSREAQVALERAGRLMGDSPKRSPSESR